MSAVRIAPGVIRGAAINIIVDGEHIAGFAGETIATTMLAAGHSAFRSDTRGRERGIFCNMGSCCECLVTLAATGRRVRACLIEARDGIEILTHD